MKIDFKSFSYQYMRGIFKACRCCLLLFVQGSCLRICLHSLQQCCFLMLLLFSVLSPTLAGLKVKSCQVDCFSTYLRQAISQNIDWVKKCLLFLLSEERQNIFPYMLLQWSNYKFKYMSLEFWQCISGTSFSKRPSTWLAKPEQKYPELPCFFLKMTASLVT